MAYSVRALESDRLTLVEWKGSEGQQGRVVGLVGRSWVAYINLTKLQLHMYIIQLKTTTSCMSSLCIVIYITQSSAMAMGYIYLPCLIHIRTW